MENRVSATCHDKHLRNAVEVYTDFSLLASARYPATMKITLSAFSMRTGLSEY